MVPSARSAPVVLNSNLGIRHVLNTATGDGAKSIRIVKDPRDNRLYYLKDNGDIYEVNLVSGSSASTSAKVFTSAAHGIKGASGLAIGPDGTFFIVGNTSIDSNTRTFATIARGALNSSGQRVWSELARTEPYPRSNTYFNHVFNGIVVRPDGQAIYVNSGSRTDHGEEQTFNGAFPNTREVPLTTKIFRLPASGQNLTLRNDLDALRSAGYIFADGIRNSYDLAFAPNGDLFGAENGPDREMPDELNWIRESQHYGFPWRMGGMDTPQQFANYDPTKDKLIDSRYTAVFRNDPSYPPAPAQMAEPVINLGPDADKFRDPDDGQIKDASDLGVPFSTFTAHRSPLGLVFDVAGSMAPPFQKHGFVLGWTKGDPSGTGEVGPFKDASQDLLDLELTKLGNTNYQARVTRIVGGFSNPIDAEIIGNRIYVIEYGGDQGVWEVTFPVANTPPTLSSFSDRTVNRDQSTGPIEFTIGDAEKELESLVVTASSSNKVLVPDTNIVLGGSGANRTVVVTPAQGQVGQTTVTVTVTDGAGSATSRAFVLTVRAPDSPPTISSIADQTVLRNQTTTPISFTMGDAETAADLLKVSARSSNTVLVPDANILLGGTGVSRTLTITPAADQTGQTTITVTVTDAAGNAAGRSFVLTVTIPENMAPTISSIGNQTIGQNQTLSSISFTVGDDQTPTEALVIRVSSSNKALVLDENILLSTANGANRSLAVVPVRDQTGQTTITLSVTDGGNKSASTSFTLTVTMPENAAPTISSIPNQTIDVGQSTSQIGFSVDDGGPNPTAASDLVVTAQSSNQTLVPISNITLGGSGVNRTVMVQAAAGQTGTTTITLIVADKGPGTPQSATTTFTVTVGNQPPPAISSIADQTIEKNGSTAALPFTISNSEGSAVNLVASARSDNTSLVPASAVVLGGTGSNRTVMVTPTRDQIGVARLTITVTDSGGKTASTSFTLTVTQPPIVQGDFDQNGYADLLFQNDDGLLAAWLMNGAELSSAAFLTPSHVGDAAFRIVGSGDFNRDGQPDIVFQHVDGTLAVWGMQGTALDAAALPNPNHPGDKNWRVAAVADVNRDGKADLVFQHTRGTLAVWQMNGLTLSTATLLDPSHPGDFRWKVVGAGDLNGDEKADLIFQHADGTLATWLMDGTKLTTASLLDPPHPGDINWRVVAVGQYGSALTAMSSGETARPEALTGKVDLIFQHRDYTLAVWFLSGAKLETAQLLKPSNSGATWRVAAPR